MNLSQILFSRFACTRCTCLSKYIIENNDHSAKLWLNAPRTFVTVTPRFGSHSSRTGSNASTPADIAWTQRSCGALLHADWKTSFVGGDGAGAQIITSAFGSIFDTSSGD